MNDVIYWAVLLDGESKAKLLSAFPPLHPKVYAEHMTIKYGPKKEDNEILEPILGKNVALTVVSHVADDKGQAAVVSGFPRMDEGTAHITISCSLSTKPSYSNQLIASEKHDTNVLSLTLNGKVSAFTKKGWVS